MPVAATAAGERHWRWRSRSAIWRANCRSSGVTAALSDFADARSTPRSRTPSPSGCPAPAAGFAAHRARQAGQPRAQLFVRHRSDPAVRPGGAAAPRRRGARGRRRCGSPGASSSCSRRATATAMSLRVDLRLRPSPEVTPIALPVDAAISYYEIAARCRGSAPPSSARAPRRATSRSASASSTRSSPSSGAARSISARSARSARSRAASATITRKGQAFGPGFDLKRGRGGIREVEFFAQIHQLIHGGREPALRAPATLDALAALATAGWLDAGARGHLAEAYRAAAHDRAPRADGRRSADPSPPCRSRRARQCRPAARPRRRRRAARLLSPHVGAVGAQYDALVGEAGERLSADPAVLRDCARRTGLRRAGYGGEARRRLALGPGPFAAIPAGAGRVRGGAAGADRGDRDGRDPPHALNRLADLIERAAQRGQFLPPARGPAGTGDRARRRSSAMPRRSPTSWRGGPTARRADRRFQLRRTAGGRRRRRRTRGRHRRPADRRRARRFRRIVSERRFALGVQLVTAQRDAARHRAGLLRRVAEAAIEALADATLAEFAQDAWPGRRGRAGHPRPRAARRRGADPCVRPRPHLPVHAPLDRESDGPKPLAATDYYQSPRQRVTAALSVPTAAGPLYEVDTRLRPSGAKGTLAVLARRVRPLPARTRPGPGSIWRCPAPGRSSGRRTARKGVERRIDALLAPAARSRHGRAPTRARMRARWRATSRPPGRSTSSWAPAAWSTSNSRSTRCS